MIHRCTQCIILAVAISSSYCGYSAATKPADTKTLREVFEAQKRVDKKPRTNQASTMGHNVRVELIKGIGKSISFLTKTAKDLPRRSLQRFKMLERLLNLHLEHAAFSSATEQDAYNAEVNKWEERARTGQKPLLDNRISSSHWRDVSIVAGEIVGEYPGAEGLDDVLFKQGLALQFSAHEAQAVAIFNDVIRRFPKSEILGDVHFALGEYYFNTNNFGIALSHYQSTIRFGESTWYGWALFKLAWTNYNLKAFEPALQEWKKAVAYAESKGEDGNQLLNECLRDMVLAFAELRDMDGAIAYFHRHKGEGQILRLLQVMATYLLEKGQFNESIAANRKIVTLFPSDRASYEASKEILRIFWEKRNYALLWPEAEQLVQRYRTGSKWSEAQEDEEYSAQIDKNLQDLVIYFPKVLQKEGDQKKEPAIYQQAEKGYELFVKFFPDSAAAVEVLEHLADSRYAQKEYERAGDTYWQVAKLGREKTIVMDQATKKSINVHQRDSKNMLEAYNKAFAAEYSGLLKRTPNFEQPTIPSGIFTKLERACAYYHKEYPDDTVINKNCNILAADIAYRTGNKPKAIRALSVVALGYAGTKEGTQAVENVVPLLKDDKAALGSFAKKILAHKGYANTKIAERVRLIVRDIDLEAIAVESSASKRAVLWEEQAKADPKAKDADKIWFNAGSDHLKAGEIAKAVGAYLFIVKSYPGSSIYPDAVLQLGKLYDVTFNRSAALSYLALFAAKYPARNEASVTMNRACYLQIAEDYKRAVAPCSQVAKWNAADAQTGIERIIQVAALKQDYGFMTNTIDAHYLRAFKLSADQKISALYKIYKYVGGSDRARAANEILSTLSSGGATSSSGPMVAQVQYDRIASGFDQILGKKLRGGSVEALQGSIQEVAGDVDRLEKRCAPILATKDPRIGVAIFYNLGMAYQHFSRLMSDPPTIPGFQIQDIKAQLKGSVDQTAQKANEYLSSADQTARKFNVLNEAAALASAKKAASNDPHLSFKDLIVHPDIVSTRISSSVISEVK